MHFQHHSSNPENEYNKDTYRISSNKPPGAYLFSAFLDWGLIGKGGGGGKGLLEAGSLLNFCVFQWKHKKKD